MSENIKIPQLGESVAEATIGTLLKPDGTSVNEGDEIVELETEKVNQVLYAPMTGMLRWQVKEGQTVKIGDTIGSIEPGRGPPKSPEIKPPEKPIPEMRPKEMPPRVGIPSEVPPPAPPEIQGKSFGQRLMKEAFIKELSEPAGEPPSSITPPIQPSVSKSGETRRRMTKIRQTIANRLVNALHSAAMLTTFNEVDMSTIMNLRAKYKEAFVKKHGVKLGLMSFFVKAIVEGLKTFPDFNSYIEGEEIVTRHKFDIGIAVGGERGLIVPVVRACDKLSFPEIEKEIALFAEKARTSKLTIGDLEGGGFTITNGGIYGSMLSTPILNPPQVGILGMHNIIKRAVVVNDAIVIRPMMYLALSYDHRLIDGKEAVSFLVHVKEVLEDPSRLMFIDIDG